MTNLIDSTLDRQERNKGRRLITLVDNTKVAGLLRAPYEARFTPFNIYIPPFRSTNDFNPTLFCPLNEFNPLDLNQYSGPRTLVNYNFNFKTGILNRQNPEDIGYFDPDSSDTQDYSYSRKATTQRNVYLFVDLFKFNAVLGREPIVRFNLYSYLRRSAQRQYTEEIEETTRLVFRFVLEGITL